jgi:hypothetical protein
MYDNLRVLGAYLTWTVLFIALGGAALTPLIAGPARVRRSYVIFGAGFFVYAAGWIAAYFTLHGAAGEWVGSLAGSVLMSLAIAACFRAWPLVPRLSVALFVANSIGYFVGSWLNETARGKTGMLLWGAVYGLCLGAGLGIVLYLVQFRLLPRGR